MARQRIISPLPSLKSLMPSFSGFDERQSKRAQIVAFLRTIIVDLRSTKSMVFYPVRDIADAFGVSLRTANLARVQLAEEGLLVSAWGSHCRIPGTDEIGRTHVQGVVGLPLWSFGVRYSHFHRFLPLDIAELLWKQNMVLESILYQEITDREPTFSDLLLHHRMDYALWMYPFAHYRQTLRRLQDVGIRSLIFAHDMDRDSEAGHIVLDNTRALKKIFTYWTQEHRIKRLYIIQGGEYDRGRSRAFIHFAREAGFECVLLEPGAATAQDVLRLTAKKPKQTIGVVLLDEHSTAEFVFYHPEAFIRVIRRHRVLMANNTVNIPFVENKAYSVERLFVSTHEAAELINRVLLQWRWGEQALTKTVRLNARYDVEWPVHRYI